MTQRALTLLVSTAVLALALAATARADDWTTIGADAQRSSWVRKDFKISPETVRNPDFQFLWKIDTGNEPRAGNGLSTPILLDFLISHRGFRSLAFLGGGGGGVYVIDTDLSRMEWERHFLPVASAASAQCPGGITSSLTRPTQLAYPSMLGFLARGRRSPAESAVGKPGAGAVTLSQGPAQFRPPSNARPASRTRAPARASLRGVKPVYVLSASGALHALLASNGRDHLPPTPFLPANSNARGLIVTDGTAFVATTNGCGGAPDGVWALDLETDIVRTWESDGGPVAGAAGMAFDPRGNVFVATADGSLVALQRKLLSPLQASEPMGFKSSPLVFDYAGADHVAAIAKDGSLVVFEAQSLRRPVARAQAGTENTPTDTALAAWRGSDGTHWLVVPTENSFAGWKLTGEGNEAVLEKGWEAGEMGSPLPPIVVNGVVFALDGGSSEASARLHALDGETGKLLWDSGDSIDGPAGGHTLSAGPSHVYMTSTDGGVYSFGFPIEH